MKNFKNKYFLMMFIGAAMTLLILFKLFDENNKFFYIVLDIFAMLGSGVFCSSIVSWIVDKQNQKASAKTKEEQRKFILSPVQRSIINLYKRELTELSIYHTNYILNKPGKWIKKELTLSEIGIEIINLLNKIKICECEQQYKDSTRSFTIDSIDRDNKKHIHLVKNLKWYYESVYEELQRVLNESDTYFINEIFDEKQIDNLKMLIWDVRDNMSFVSEQEIYNGTTLEIKLGFFEKTEEIISLLNITDKKEFMHYRDI